MVHVLDALERLKQAGGTVEVVLRRPDAPRVEDVEKALGLVFPSDVRQFYDRFEYVQIGGKEIEWIRNLVALTTQIRTRTNTPHSYLPIEDDGLGGYYHVVCASDLAVEDTTLRSGETGAVVRNTAGVPDLVELVAPRFFDFVIDQIEQELDAIGG
jgi:hypothetical protein